MASAGWVLLLAGAGAALYLWLYSTASSRLATPQTKHSGRNPGVQLRHVNAYGDRGDERETDVDIIAIHGLDTKSPETWEYKAPGEPKVNWLADKHMLPAEVSNARIFTCDWPAELFEPSDLDRDTMKELARLLLAGIQARPLGKNKQAMEKDRPIFFIASCLGGVILMKALAIATSEYTHIQKATRGVVFLATPFRGTSFQDVARWAEPGLWAWASVRGQQTTLLLDWVKSSTRDLQDLVREFTELCKKDEAFAVHTFYEKGYTDLSRKVPFLSFFSPSSRKQLVDEGSATLDWVTHPLPLDRTHVMMNKFSRPKDKDYILVVNKIRHCLEEIRKRTPLQKADDHIRKKHYSKEKLKIERLSRGSLRMDQCYINLALVELQRASGSERINNEPSLRSSPFSLSNRLKVETPPKDLQVELAKLFEPRKLPDGQVKEPRRILIRGRAGVGKTTLCKKIVHDFIHEKMWRGLFSRVVWIRLRELKGLSNKEYNLSGIFERVFFRQYVGSQRSSQSNANKSTPN